MVEYIYDYVRLSSLPDALGRARSDLENRRLMSLRGLLEARPGTQGVRRWNRLPIARDAELTHGGQTHRAIVIEASAGGFLIRCALQVCLTLERDQLLQLRVFGVDRPPVCFPCRIAWTTRRGRVGLAITEAPFLPGARQH
jgi:hypothetical protein